MVITYHCPGCGSSMTYWAEDGQLHCEHCETVKTVAQMDALAAEGGAQAMGVCEDLQVYHCPNCGAEVVTDEHTIATVCSFCGSTDLIQSRMEGVQRPEWVIPFTIGKEEAEERFLAWAKKGVFAPAGFTARKTLDQITGMYVPFWLYDVDVNVQMGANATRTYVTRFADTETIHTKHYRVVRNVSAEYEKFPADASKKMDDTLMDQMEPFRYDQMRPFEMPYLSGYLAEKYNDSSDELFDRVKVRAENYAQEATRETITGYQTVSVDYKQISSKAKKASYALMPVWMLRYQYMGKEYAFTMNGTTGKIIGEIPMSSRKMLIAGALIGVVTFVVLSLGSILLGGL